MTTKKRGPGRPSVANPANVRLNVRVTETKRAAYHAAAEAHGMTLSAWLEKLADRASGFRGE